VPGQGRLGDKANVPLDAHGCPACPHPATGPAIQGSPDVNVNRLPALRVGDPGIHSACCGTNTWTATEGSATVFINGKRAHRMGDQSRHCGGMGRLIEGSPNVIVGEESSRASGSGGTSSVDRGSGAGGQAGGSDADHAEPGDRNARSDGGGGARVAGGDRRGDLLSDDPTSYFELVLVDEDGEPASGERYRVTTSDDRVLEGRLDSRGMARIDGIARGTCQVSFPDLTTDEWRKA